LPPNGRFRVTNSEVAAIVWAIGMGACGACVAEEQEIGLGNGFNFRAVRGRETHGGEQFIGDARIFCG
jgi:hypothetical protein